ncbi:hypothetical protein P8452_71098 [Trifolium repens]|jgi:hypothetical protein|nr:hypothetical protein P8452_71098 [Trifolium repens]
MASPLLLLLLITLSISHPSSQMILLPLTHSLSKTHFNTTHHLLKSTTTRSTSRFHHHYKNHHQLSLPLSPGTDYTLSFNFGPHSQPITLYMDTGSDLVWFSCTPFNCILCELKPNPPSSSSSPPTNISHSTQFHATPNTTRKLAFSNRFRDRKISVTIETDLETDILNVNF